MIRGMHEANTAKYHSNNEVVCFNDTPVANYRMLHVGEILTVIWDMISLDLEQRKFHVASFA